MHNRMKLFDYMSLLHGSERLRPIASAPLTYTLLAATFPSSSLVVLGKSQVYINVSSRIGLLLIYFS